MEIICHSRILWFRISSLRCNNQCQKCHASWRQLQRTKFIYRRWNVIHHCFVMKMQEKKYVQEDRNSLIEPNSGYIELIAAVNYIRRKFVANPNWWQHAQRDQTKKKPSKNAMALKIAVVTTSVCGHRVTRRPNNNDKIIRHEMP